MVRIIYRYMYMCNAQCSRPNMPNLLSIPNANAANKHFYLFWNWMLKFIFETCRSLMSRRCFNMAGTWSICSGQNLFGVHGIRYARYSVYWNFIVVIIQQMDSPSPRDESTIFLEFCQSPFCTYFECSNRSEKYVINLNQLHPVSCATMRYFK